MTAWDVFVAWFVCNIDAPVGFVVGFVLSLLICGAVDAYFAMVVRKDPEPAKPAAVKPAAVKKPKA
jgi:hypothetical protein